MRSTSAIKLRKQAGFHLIELAIVVAVLGVIGFVGFKVLGGGDKAKNSNQSAQGGESESGSPIWEYNMDDLEWFVKSGKAPECTDPIIQQTPVDMSKVTATGLPGAYRGYSYKPHGSFRVADSTEGIVEVRMPMDANFRGVTRYYEAIPGQPDELQYLVTFENDCGIAFRFDHLFTLSPELQAWAEKSPPPKKNDTSSNPNAERISVPMKAGDLVATQVGFPKARNYGFDFGVYDYRQTNDISKNKPWADIHRMYSSLDFHGICWIDMLPTADAAKAKAQTLDRANYNSNRPFNVISDYCSYAPSRTLDFNNGQPTDG